MPPRLETFCCTAILFKLLAVTLEQVVSELALTREARFSCRFSLVHMCGFPGLYSAKQFGQRVSNRTGAGLHDSKGA